MSQFSSLPPRFVIPSLLQLASSPGETDASKPEAKDGPNEQLSPQPIILILLVVKTAAASSATTATAQMIAIATDSKVFCQSKSQTFVSPQSLPESVGSTTLSVKNSHNWDRPSSTFNTADTSALPTTASLAQRQSARRSATSPITGKSAGWSGVSQGLFHFEQREQLTRCRPIPHSRLLRPRVSCIAGDTVTIAAAAGPGLCAIR